MFIKSEDGIMLNKEKSKNGGYLESTLTMTKSDSLSFLKTQPEQLENLKKSMEDSLSKNTIALKKKLANSSEKKPYVPGPDVRARRVSYAEASAKFKEFMKMMDRLVDRQSKRPYASESDKTEERVRLYSMYRSQISGIVTIAGRSHVPAEQLALYRKVIRKCEKDYRNAEKILQGKDKSILNGFVEDVKDMDDYRENSKSFVRMDYDTENSGIDAATADLVRNVDQWILRRTKDHRVEFVQNFMSHSLRERLYMYHLIEHGRRKEPDQTDVVYAMTMYKPDLEVIKLRMQGTKWKFWRRLPGASNMYWDKLSDCINDLGMTVGNETVAGQLKDMDVKSTREEFTSEEALEDSLYKYGDKTAEEIGRIMGRKHFANMKQHMENYQRYRDEAADAYEKHDEEKMKDCAGKALKQMELVHLAVLKLENNKYLYTNSKIDKNEVFRFIKEFTDPIQGNFAKHGVNANFIYTKAEVLKGNTSPDPGPFLGAAAKGVIFFANGKNLVDALGYMLNVKKNFKADDNLSAWDNADRKAEYFYKLKTMAQSGITIVTNIIGSKEAMGVLGESLKYFNGLDMVYNAYKAGKTLVRTCQNKRATNMIRADHSDDYDPKDQECVDYITARLKNSEMEVFEDQEELDELFGGLTEQELREELANYKAKVRHGRYKENMLHLNDRLRTTNRMSAGLNLLGSTVMFAASVMTGGAGAATTIAGIALNYVISGFMSFRTRNDKMSAVDHFLGINEKIDSLIRLDKLKDSAVEKAQVKMALRRSLIAKLGFATINGFFGHVAAKYADFILKSAISETENGDAENGPYISLIRSYGLKAEQKDGRWLLPDIRHIAGKLMGK